MMSCIRYHDTRHGDLTGSAVVTPPPPPPAGNLTYTIQDDFPSAGLKFVTLFPPSGKTLKFGQTTHMVNQISPSVAFWRSGSGTTETFNFTSPPDAGTYNVIVNVQYTDNSTEELRFNFTVAAEPAPPPPGAEVTMTFTPDYFNHTFTATLNPPAGYQIRPGTASYELEMTSPSMQRITQDVGLNANFSGMLPLVAGDYYFNVNCVLNDSGHTAFNFQQPFTITEAELLKPRLDFHPDAPNNHWDAILIAPQGKAFTAGSINWTMDRVAPFPHSPMYPAAGAPLQGALVTAGMYRINVDFLYDGDAATRHFYSYDVIYGDINTAATFNFNPNYPAFSYTGNVVPPNGFSILPGSVTMQFFDENNSLLATLGNTNGNFSGGLPHGASAQSFYYVIDGQYSDVAQTQFVLRYDFTMP